MEPVGADAVAIEPVGADAEATEPVGAEAIATEPVGAEPVAMLPAGAEPLATIPDATCPVGRLAAGTLAAATLDALTVPVEPLRDAKRAFFAAARLLINDFFFKLIVFSALSDFSSGPSCPLLLHPPYQTGANHTIDVSSFVINKAAESVSE